MVTKEEVLADVARMVARQGALLDTLSAREAAERAWRPGGPSIEELTEIALARGCRPD